MVQVRASVLMMRTALEESFLFASSEQFAFSSVKSKYKNNIFKIRKNVVVNSINGFTNQALSQAQNDELDKIDSFATLEVGWDGYTAVPISLESINIAKNFILKLDRISRYMDIFPVPNGHVQFEWEKDNQYLEFEFKENNKVKVFSILQSGDEEEYVLDLKADMSKLLRMVDNFE